MTTPRRKLQIIVAGQPKTGKTTIAELLFRMLVEAGHPVTVTDEDLQMQRHSPETFSARVAEVFANTDVEIVTRMWRRRLGYDDDDD